MEDKIFRIIKWAAVAEWTFDVEIPEKCSICRYKLTERCVNCIAFNMDRSKCDIGMGKCKHAFHIHCVDQWVIKKARCPLDEQPWVLEKKLKL